MLSKRDSSFFRYRVPQREMDRRGGDRSQPLHTPAMAGGLFSIDKDYFYEIGKRQFDKKNYLGTIFIEQGLILVFFRFL